MGIWSPPQNADRDHTGSPTAQNRPARKCLLRTGGAPETLWPRCKQLENGFAFALSALSMDYVVSLIKFCDELINQLRGVLKVRIDGDNAVG